jgi:hypothetical protein
MNISFKLFGAVAKPSLHGFENVISLIQWGIDFEQDGVHSVAYIETPLDTANIADSQTFVPMEQLTKEQLLDFAKNAQGEQHIDTLTQAHAAQLVALIAAADTTPYQGPVVFDTL